MPSHFVYAMPVSKFSWWLVGLQFALLTFIFTTGPWCPHHIIGLAAFTAGWMICIAAFYSFRKSKFTVFPEPRRDAQLLTDGVYAFVRHPFYTAVLLIAGALVFDYYSWLRLLAWSMLLIVLLIKIEYEEKMLQQQFDTYAAYKQRTWRLIPFVW